MTRESALRIALLYPELLGTYGDGGNAVILERRMTWRGLAVEMVPVHVGAPPPGGCDLYLLGGGEDDAQTAVLQALTGSAALASAADREIPIFAVCAGLQLLGETLELHDGEIRPGLGLLDITTTRLPRRAVGEVIAHIDEGLALPELTGFENHGGATSLGAAARPLARVMTGVGNGGTPEGGEGALQGSIVATYLHGPVLARNPALADLLLSRALGTTLAPLDLDDVDALRRDRLAAGRSSP